MNYLYIVCILLLCINPIATYAVQENYEELRLNIKNNDIEVVFADEIYLELDIGFFTSDISIGGTNLPYPNGIMYLKKIDNCQHDCKLRVFLSPINSGVFHKKLYGLNFTGVGYSKDSIVKIKKGETKTIRFEISRYLYSEYGIKYPGAYSVYIEMRGNKSNTFNIKLKEDGAIRLLIKNLSDDSLKLWAADRLEGLTWFDFSSSGDYSGYISNETICGWQKWFKENKGRFFWNKDELRFNIQ